MLSDGLEKNYLGDALGGELGGALAAAEASAAPAAAALPTYSTCTSADDGPTVNFVLMTRKGNKPQFKNLAVPSDSDLAQNLRNREEVNFLDKTLIKTHFHLAKFTN